MGRPPIISAHHKICIICEGAEDFGYLERLLELQVWNEIYDFKLINAKSASNIPARYQNEFQNDNYELVIIFCDTDKFPYREYSLIKKKISDFHGGNISAVQDIIMFANPCTMQIILMHFAEISLKSQGKKTNADIIESLTGVKNYDAHERQIREICTKIYKRTYPEMKERISKINHSDTVSGSTNFIKFINRFESANTKWIKEINENICT